MDQALALSYAWVKQTREVVFRYCETLPPQVYVREHSDFGFGSIRNLHAHVAERYLWWVGTAGLGLPEPTVERNDLSDVTAMRRLFAQVDAGVDEALRNFTCLDEVYEWTPPGRDRTVWVSQRWLILNPLPTNFTTRRRWWCWGRFWATPLPRPTIPIESIPRARGKQDHAPARTDRPITGIGVAKIPYLTRSIGAEANLCDLGRPP